MSTSREDPEELASAAEVERQLATFGRALRNAYRSAGLSKRAIASAASLDRSSVSKIEQGRRTPNFSTLLALAQAAKTTPAALLGGIGPDDVTIPPIEYEDGPPNDPTERFAANLRWVREHVEPYLTQEGLAEEADIDRSSPNAYEMGRKRPNLQTLFKLAAGLGVGPSVLMDGVRLSEPLPSDAQLDGSAR